MSLSMATGQAGAGIGGAMAGGAYALSGYAGNAALAAATSIAIALLVWRMLPDTGPGSDGACARGREC